MKKQFQIIGVLTLIWFSFFCTERTIFVIKNNDDIMIKINEEKEKYNTKSTDSIIIKDTIIPGLSGNIVNEEKSYEKMKRLGAYTPSLYIYNDVSPTITINDNYDKYIVSGNTKKRNIYLIFAGNINQIREVYRILNNDEIKGTFLLEDKKYTEISKYINNRYDLIVTEKNNYKNIEKKVFCYNENKEKSFLNYCVSNKYFSVQPQITIKDELYKDIKNNATSGLIILVKINDKTKYEIPTVINYLKSKGYEISNLNDLVKE